jgi:hypothetical protein
MAQGNFQYVRRGLHMVPCRPSALMQITARPRSTPKVARLGQDTTLSHSQTRQPNYKIWEVGSLVCQIVICLVQEHSNLKVLLANGFESSSRCISEPKPLKNSTVSSASATAGHASCTSRRFSFAAPAYNLTLRLVETQGKVNISPEQLHR